MTQQQLDQQQLQELAEQLSEQEAINSEREAQLDQYKASLDEKEEELNAQRATLQQDLEDLRRQEQSINDRSRNLDTREQQLDDREGGLQVHEDALAQRDREIREREDRLTAIANLPENLRKHVELGAITLDEARQKMREEILPTPVKPPQFNNARRIGSWIWSWRVIRWSFWIIVTWIIVVSAFNASAWRLLPAPKVQPRPAVSQPVQQRPANTAQPTVTVVPTATPWWPVVCSDNSEDIIKLVSQIRSNPDGLNTLDDSWDSGVNPDSWSDSERKSFNDWLASTKYCQ